MKQQNNINKILYIKIQVQLKSIIENAVYWERFLSPFLLTLRSDMNISIFEIFKIGIGPSSSHTMGPWRAALAFIEKIKPNLPDVARISVNLYGSLAKTGKGHGTDFAILMGLSGLDPITCPVDALKPLEKNIRETQQLHLNQEVLIPFVPEQDMRFNLQESLPQHPNGMSIQALFNNGEIISETYFSIGGGFIQALSELDAPNAEAVVKLPFPIQKAEEIVLCCKKEGISMIEMSWTNELQWRNRTQILQGLTDLWQTMLDCIYAGCTTPGILAGGLQVKRRAAEMTQQLLGIAQQNVTHSAAFLHHFQNTSYNFQQILSWVSIFALAVNEENAAFRRVVTAPTNGAAGVIPAVLMYHLAFNQPQNPNKDRDDFLMIAGEIGCLFKKGATISAAMGGCQAEIGVSSAMAAAGLTACLGGSTDQILMAAEIAMEHHLGLTCDPIGGLVQIPCIERNAMGAMKAITASHLALSGNPQHAKVSLDDVIATMWQTALDMNHKYKETAEGGLAVQISVNVAEC